MIFDIKDTNFQIFLDQWSKLFINSNGHTETPISNVIYPVVPNFNAKIIQMLQHEIIILNTPCVPSIFV